MTPLTHDSILNLKGVELSRAMAERVMRWHEDKSVNQVMWIRADGSFINTSHLELWYPHLSLDQCHRAFENLTDEQQERYGAALAELVGIQLITGVGVSYDDIAAIAEADCETRCRAMLCAILET